MPRTIAQVRAWFKSKKTKWERPTFKHRPTVKIPDPTYDAIFRKEKDYYGSGFPRPR